MIRKYLNLFNRGLIVGFEILGVLAVVAFAGWGLLVARLSQGPLNVDFLTHPLEQSFNSQQNGFNLSVGATMLTWGGSGQPFIFEMNHVQVLRSDNTPVFAVEKVGVQLSKKYLVLGKLVPRVVRIDGPALRVVRGEDGRLSLNVAGAPAAQPPETVTSGATETAQADLLGGILGQMGSHSGHFGHLEQIYVRGAAVLYEDKILGVNWKSMNSTIDIQRSREGLMADVLANIDLDAAHTATIRAGVNYGWQTRRSSVLLSFTHVVPALVAQQSPALRRLAGIDLPLKGSILLNLDNNFVPGAGRVMIEGEPGRLTVPGLYDTPVAIEKFDLRGHFDLPSGAAAVENLEATVGSANGPQVQAWGSVLNQAEGHALALDAVLKDMPIDKLKVYWPAALAPDARKWVTGQLSAGVATKATLGLSLLFPHACAQTCATPLDDFGPLKLQKVGGDIDFNGIKVDYFPPLMPVLKVNGHATYDQKSFNLNLVSGALGDMQVTGSSVAITDLDIADDKVHSKIDISVGLKGPLRTALKVLDSKPLGYPKKLGLDTAAAEGAATLDVGFRFPLYDNLRLEDVKASAKATLDDVALKGLVADLVLKGGPLAVKFEEGKLTAKGKATLGTMPVDFDWLRNFTDKAAVAQKLDATITLDAAGLSSLGVPEDLKIAGTVPATVSYVVAGDQSAVLDLKGDVTPAAFTVAAAGYEKLPQAPGALSLQLQFRKGILSAIRNLDLKTDKAELKGGVAFASDGKAFKSASFDRARLGNTDVKLTLDSRGSEGYIVAVSGSQFDASTLLADDNAPNSDEEAARPATPMSITMNVDKLLTGEGKGISQLRLALRRNTWKRLEQAEIDGISGGKALTLRYEPAPKGHTLHFEAGNAGAALSALGITNGVRGGRLVVEGFPNTKDPGKRNLYGTVVLTDFTLVNVPVLGRLLNAMSLSGFFELLNGKGIAFQKMRSDFYWLDKGQPDTPKNARLIVLREGQTSGASLGLTFEGKIDNWNNTLDMSGTIIPVSDINKIVSSIPLVGNILTGGGKGIIAATYTIQGAKADPSVKVNPLSVLAPGILRKIFFEK